jgi:hypothetical protein
MTYLLLLLLVVYFAVVSAPIPLRLIGLILMRNGSSKSPPIWGPETVHSGAPKDGGGAVRRHAIIRNRHVPVQHMHVQGGQS